MLVRTVECLEGRVEVELICEPVFDYGRDAGGRGRSSTATATPPTRPAPGRRSASRSDLALGIEGNRVRARHVLEAGDRAFCALSWAEEPRRARTTSTTRRRGSPRPSASGAPGSGAPRIPDHRWRDPIQRSALAIKGLTYMPTGATVAALTTSLPETPGGERNWDYRYTWMRDTTFTLQALHWLNLDWEADEFMQFVADVEPTEDGSLQIMYGIDGRRDLTESTLDELTGYAGARPVRIGNGAFDQRQNDVFGAVLDSILLHTRRSQAAAASPLADRRDAGRVRDARSGASPTRASGRRAAQPQHYVSSKLMCWVALDRAAKLAEIRGDQELQATWSGDRGGDPGGHPRARRERARASSASTTTTDALDASVLLAAIFGFLPRDDERLHATVHAIADELTEDGFVLRYRTDETDDGLSGKEGTFLICSFWLVSALAIVGELQRARDLMERLLRIASPLGLYAEEFDAEHRRATSATSRRRSRTSR